MADTNPGGGVARLETLLLAELWGAEVEVKKSARGDKRFPLYLSTRTGPVFLNSQRGQDFLLEYAKFYGANDPKPQGEPDAEPIGETATAPEPVKSSSPSETTGSTENKRTFLSWFNEPIL